jgi:hypothetical protein
MEREDAILFHKSPLLTERRIREVPGLNLGPETGYPEGFRSFPRSIQANAGVAP